MTLNMQRITGRRVETCLKFVGQRWPVRDLLFMWMALMCENRAFVFFTAVSLIHITVFHIG